MNEYKFINAESMRTVITELLKAETKKIHFPPEFEECELKEAWWHEYVGGCLENANEIIDMSLDMAYDPYGSFDRVDCEYNKHITGEFERNTEQFQDLVNRVRNEDQSEQTKADLEFLGKWYLDNFAKDEIINPFVKFVKEWAYEWA